MQPRGEKTRGERREEGEERREKREEGEERRVKRGG